MDVDRPVKGWSIEMITTRPMVTRTDSTPVIETCASRFSLPKKSVKPTVKSAPMKSTIHMTLGTSPVARCSLTRRAAVTLSSCRKTSVMSAGPLDPVRLRAIAAA